MAKLAGGTTSRKPGGPRPPLKQRVPAVTPRGVVTPQVQAAPVISGRAGVGPTDTKTLLGTIPLEPQPLSPLKPVVPVTPVTQFEQARENRAERYAAQWGTEYIPGLGLGQSKTATRAASLAARAAAKWQEYLSNVGPAIKLDPAKAGWTGAPKVRPTTGFDGGGYDYGGGGGGGRPQSYNGGSGLINWRIGY